MKGLTAMLPGASEPDPADEMCGMCPSLTYQQVSLGMCDRREGEGVAAVQAEGRKKASRSIHPPILSTFQPHTSG